jgi:hypothetical protein
MFSALCILQHVQVLHNDSNFLIYNKKLKLEVGLQDLLLGIL